MANSGGPPADSPYWEHNKTYTPPKPVDKIGDAMDKGQARAEEVTGASASEVGEKRGEIRNKYEDIIDGPSRGTARMAASRNADLKRQRAQQAKSGVSGGMAQAQDNQLSQDYATKMGDTTQNEYMSALDKLERQYRGVGTDITKMGAQYAGLEVGGQPAPQAPQMDGLLDTFICTELLHRGLITRVELLIMHILLVVGSVFKPAQTIFYLTHGKKLVENMIADNIHWSNVKLGLFDGCFYEIKKGKIIYAIESYEYVTRSLFNKYGFSEEVEQFDSKWTFKRVRESFRLMMRI